MIGVCVLMSGAMVVQAPSWQLFWIQAQARMYYQEDVGRLP
jgi:hypothetical protein